MARYVAIDIESKGADKVVDDFHRIRDAALETARAQAQAFRDSPQFQQAQAARAQTEQLRAASRVQQEEVRNAGKLQVEQLRQQERAARESAKAMMDTAKAAGREQIAADKQVSRERLAQTRAAEQDLKRLERERLQIFQANERAIERLARQEANARIREGRRVANEALRDSQLRQRAARTAGGAGLGGLSGLGAGALAAGATGAAVAGVSLLGREALTTAASLDTLIRYTSTLDKTFQSAAGREALRRDFLKLSTEIPQTAEDIARASFSVKSAFASLTEPELIAFLRETGAAATASNTQIDIYAESVIGLAKAFGVAASELPAFAAQLSATLGEALARDPQVFAGLNKLIVPAKLANQSLKDLFASFATLQAVSSDAEANTTNLVNAYNKLTEAKTQERLQDIAGISTTDQKTGKLKDLSVVVNELAEKLKNLTPAERSGEIAKIFPDAQARAAFGVLLNDIDNYNRRLRDASDAEAFRQKTDVMLAGAEARWLLFKNRVSVILTDIGGSILRNTTTWSSYFDQLLIDLDANVSRLKVALADAFISFGLNANEALGTAPTALIANARADWENSIKQAYAGIDAVQTASQAKIIQKEREYWQQLANDPAASQAVKANAQRQLAALADGATQARQAGVKVAAAYAEGIPEVLKSFKPQVQAAQQQLTQGNPGAANAAGQQVGAAMGSGMVAGLRGHIGKMTAMADLAVAAIKSRFTSAEGLDIHSPSRVFAGYGRDIIEGLILGITENGPKLAAAIEKEIVQRAKSVRKDLQAAAVNLAAALNESPQTRRTRTRLDEANDFAAKLEELRKLRSELGKPVELAVPRTLEGINRELEILNTRKEAIAAAKDLLKQFGDELKPAFATRLERVNALLAPVKVTEDLREQVELLRLRAALLDFRAAAKNLPPPGRKLTFEDNGLPEDAFPRTRDRRALPLPDDKLEKLKEYQKQIKELTDQLGAALERILVGFTGGLKSGMRAVFDELKNSIKSLLGSLAQGISRLLAEKLLGGQTSTGNPQLAHGNGSPGGGWLNSILGTLRGIFSGGAPTTPTFNGSPVPGVNNTVRAGGFLNTVRGLFGLGGGASTAASGAAGAVLPTTGTVANTINLAGGTFTTGAAASGAGAGGGLFGGGLSLAKLGAFASNPITLAVAGAAVGGFLLWRHFRHGTEKKLREAIKARYGINVRDMALLTQIKQMGEARFGRGQVGARIQETLALAGVQEALRGYAEQTGQDASRLAPSSAQLQNENFAGNRFVTGGLAGTEYAGENREQRDYFNEGAGAAGSRQRAAGSFAGGGRDAGSNAGDGGNASLRSIVAGLAVAVSELHGAVKGLTSAQPGEVLMRGAEQNPGAIGEGLSRAADRDGNLIPSLLYKGGLT